MIKTLWEYARVEVWPRKHSIVRGGEFVMAVLVAGATWWSVSQIPLGALPVRDIVGIVLTYAAIALGFCVAGMTIVLTLPHDGFARLLAKTQLPGSKTNAYSDLMFVFSWTAITHWVLIVALVGVYIWSGQGEVVSGELPGEGRRVVVGLMTGGVVYALLQFLITLITLSEVGRVYHKSVLST